MDFTRKLKKFCPKNKLINPNTQRCIKANGKVAKTVLKTYDGSTVPQCPIGKIRNPGTGRCVKISGKKAKHILQDNEVTVHIIFEPDLYDIWNDSYSSDKKKPIYWGNNIDICKYHRWYQKFSDVIQDRLSEHHIIFDGFSIYKNYLDLTIIFNKKYINLRGIEDAILGLYNNTRAPLVKLLKFALEPDTEEEFLVKQAGKLYIVQNHQIVDIIVGDIIL